MIPTAEQLEFRALAREFATGEIRPHAEAWDAERRLPDALFANLAELGFLGMRMPEAQGGLGVDTPTFAMVLEALAWGDASVALAVAIHNGPIPRALEGWGSEEQQARWFPELASGQVLGAFSLTEPGAGSDPSALATRARVRDGSWVLDGRKSWVTNGDRAGLILLFARTGADDSGREGISAFLVPRNTPGLQVVDRERTLGLSASETVSLELVGVELPENALLGSPGDGYEIAMDALLVGRIGVAAQALGIGQAAFEHALRYADEREQFGRSLHRFGAVREKLAEMAIRLRQARLLTLDAATRLDQGQVEDQAHLPNSPRALSSMAKVAASEAAMWVTDEAVQIFGGYGYMRDYPVERLMRDAKGTQIYEGANEVLRMAVAADAVREFEGGG